MFRTADFLLVFFWSATYVIIIVNSIRHRAKQAMYMPFISGAMNFAWELCALVGLSDQFWGHIVWLTLDSFILAYNLWLLVKRKNPRVLIAYALLVAGLVVLLYWAFQKFKYGMLLSSFLIDCFMAFEFLLTVKQISPHGKILVAGAKLLGDLFAWLAYHKTLNAVLIIGIVVFIVNSLYFYRCTMEYRKRKNQLSAQEKT